MLDADSHVVNCVQPHPHAYGAGTMGLCFGNCLIEWRYRLLFNVVHHVSSKAINSTSIWERCFTLKIVHDHTLLVSAHLY